MLRYSDITFDGDGYASVPTNYPQKFEIVKVENIKKNSFPAWWTGKEWMSKNPIIFRVIKWKRVFSNERSAA